MRHFKLEFRQFVLLSALVTYGVMILGVLLRVTGGTACPDWPICYGSVAWPLPAGAWLDYAHRWATVISMVLSLSAWFWAWRQIRNQRWLMTALSLAAGLLVLQVGLSGMALLDLVPQMITSPLHLTLALAMLGAQLLASVLAFQKHQVVKLSWQTPFARLTLVGSGLLALLLISGTLVSTTEATQACQGWPLCQPIGWLGSLSLGHRLVVGFAGLAILAILVQAWRTQRSQTAVLVAATASAVLFVAQSLMGALEVAQGFPTHLLGLHVATSAAVFGTLVLTVVFAGLSQRTRASEVAEAQVWQERNLKGMARDLLQLTKPIVVALLLVTTYAGMVIGAQAWPSLELTIWVLVGGFMAAGGSGAINQYIDRQDDTRMQRTSKRPIPAGRLTAGEGLAFGVALTLGSFYVMAAFVNFLAALLSLAGIFYYVVLYSLLLKKTTVQNIVIGGGAGAIPPLVGWAAATGSLNIPSLFLFAVVFMWTPPHFWALAIVRRNDYARAGVPMLPVVRGERETRKQILIYTLELVGLTLLIPLFGLGGGVYLVLALILGVWLISAAWKVWKQEGNKVAWKMYRYSSMYLAFLFVALMIDALI